MSVQVNSDFGPLALWTKPKKKIKMVIFAIIVTKVVTIVGKESYTSMVIKFILPLLQQAFSGYFLTIYNITMSVTDATLSWNANYRKK